MNKRPLVYIAGPYTGGDAVLNVRRALEIGEQVFEVGGVPIVPHLCHLWHIVAPKPYEFWIDLDMEQLKHCHFLYRLNGHSPGADKEVKYALPNMEVIFEEHGGIPRLQDRINNWIARKCE